MNRVWTFISSKALSNNELNLITESGTKFVNGWTAHEQKLTASFEIYKNRIIVVKVNEEVTGASGCSIDKLTHFIKQLETEFNIELLNRLLVAYKNESEISVVHASKIKELLQTNSINENTIVYNTSVSNQNEFQNWEQPLKNTWLSKYLIFT
jgi:hypothetical protein